MQVEARADERSFKQVGQQAEKFFSVAGKEAAGSFAKAFGSGSKDARKAVDGYAKALDAVADASGKATVAEDQHAAAKRKVSQAAKQAEDAEKKLKVARDAGDTKAVAQAEKQLTSARELSARAGLNVVKAAEAAGAAKRREAREVREAITAYRNMEQAQTSRGPGFLSGITSQSSGIVGQFQMLGGMGGKAFIGGAVAALATGALVAAGAKAAGLVLDGFKSVMETGIDFSKTVNNFQAATGASDALTKQAAAAARKLGSDPTMAGVTGADSMKALTELGKSGMSPEQAMANLRSTMELATSAQITATEAAQIQANAIGAFNLNTEDAARVADVFANASIATKSTMPELSQALAQAGAVANGFGMDMNETIAMLGMFDKAGIKGSDAGTLLKTTLQSMTKAGEPAARALQALNMDVFKDGQFVGPREFIRQLEAAKKVMSQEEFLAATNQLFGTDAMRTPMVANLAMFDQILGKTHEIGTAANMAKTNMKGWPGVVEGIDNSIEALKLSFFDLFDTPGGQGLGQSIVTGLSGAVDWVNAHKPELLRFFGDIVSAATVMGQAIAVQVGITAKSFQILLEQVGTVAKTIGDGIQAIAAPLQSIPDFVLGPYGAALKKFGQDGGRAMSGFGEGSIKAADGLGAVADGAGRFANEVLPQLNDRFQTGIDAAIASEEANRLWGKSFDSVKSSLEAIPNSHEMVIKDNTAEVRGKLEQLGFRIQNMPDGRQVIRVDYRDPSGNPLSPAMMSKIMGFDVQSFNEAGDAQKARRGLDYNKPGDVAPTAPTPTSGPGVGGILGPGGVLDGPSSSGGGSGPDVAVPYGAVPALMPGIPMDASLFSAQTSVADARTKTAELEAKLNALRADNNASATDILNAQTDLEKARRDQQESEMRFQEAQISAVQKGTKQLGQLTSDMSEVGASLDQDFGISKGLAGIAENITKFVANLAAAPLMGQLSAVAKANPVQGGHGLFGALGAQGVFGSQFQNNQYAQQSSGGGMAGYGGYPGGYAPVAGGMGIPTYGGGQSYGLAKGTNTGGYGSSGAAFPDWVHQLEDAFGVKASTYSGHQESDRHERGYAPNPMGQNRGIDWSGSVSAMQNFADYLSQIPGSLEQVIWRNPNTGRSTEIAGGRTRPGYFADDLGGHQDHVHTRQSQSIPVPGMGAVSAPSYADTWYGGGAQTVPASSGTGGGGMGTGVGPGFAPAPSSMGPQTRIGGLAPAGGSGAGGIGIQSGGMIDMAIQAGGMGLDMMAPGAGQAAQMGIKLGARAAEYGGQAAGIGVQGLMETFLPTGGSELANNSWLTRIVGGLAGAAPALPNMAGGGQGKGQLENPGAAQQGQGQNVQPGMNIEKLEYNNQNATEDRAGKDLTYHLGSMYSAPGM